MKKRSIPLKERTHLNSFIKLDGRVKAAPELVLGQLFFMGIFQLVGIGVITVKF